MRVMCAMSGGVDSSVTALLLKEAGHDVVGVTMKLWGGDSDTGCCSVSDVDDARRVAQQLDIDHLVFNFGEEFDAHVVEPYVAAHVAGHDTEPVHRVQPVGEVRPARRAGRPARLRRDRHRPPRRASGRPSTGGTRSNAAPIAPRTRATWCTCSTRPSWPARCSRSATCRSREVRALASRIDLRTADKPDSQDVCFIMSTSGGRTTFLGDRIPFHRASVVDTPAIRLGEVEAIELVTIGQRKGIGLPGGGPKRYVVDVDVEQRVVVTVGDDADLLRPDRRRPRRDVGRRAGRQRGRGARAVQRPRRPAAGDDPDRRPAVTSTCRVGRAAAPDRARPERRVLRPRPTPGCSAAASPR